MHFAFSIINELELLRVVTLLRLEVILNNISITSTISLLQNTKHLHRLFFYSYQILHWRDLDVGLFRIITMSSALVIVHILLKFIYFLQCDPNCSC